MDIDGIHAAPLRGTFPLTFWFLESIDIDGRTSVTSTLSFRSQRRERVFLEPLPVFLYLHFFSFSPILTLLFKIPNIQVYLLSLPFDVAIAFLCKCKKCLKRNFCHMHFYWHFLASFPFSPLGTRTSHKPAVRIVAGYCQDFRCPSALSCCDAPATEGHWEWLPTPLIGRENTSSAFHSLIKAEDFQLEFIDEAWRDVASLLLTPVECDSNGESEECRRFRFQ